eukprot:13500010-Alexandrium_andersonii.AAC.1
MSQIEVLREDGQGGQVLAVCLGAGGTSLLAINVYLRDPECARMAEALSDAIHGGTHGRNHCR